MTEIVKRNGAAGSDVQFVNRLNGEVVTLADPTDMLVAFVGQFEAEIDRLRAEAVDAVKVELLRRMDFDRQWSITVHGRWRVESESDAYEASYDKTALYETLLELHRAEKFSTAAFERAAKVACEVKLNMTGLEALRKNPELREAIDKHRVEKPKARRPVSVKPVR